MDGYSLVDSIDTGSEEYVLWIFQDKTTRSKVLCKISIVSLTELAPRKGIVYQSQKLSYEATVYERILAFPNFVCFPQYEGLYDMTSDEMLRLLETNLRNQKRAFRIFDSLMKKSLGGKGYVSVLDRTAINLEKLGAYVAVFNEAKQRRAVFSMLIVSYNSGATLRSFYDSYFYNQLVQKLVAVVAFSVLQLSEMGITHGDLSWDNIWVRDLPYSRYYVLFGNNLYRVDTNKCPTLMNFENATMNTVSNPLHKCGGMFHPNQDILRLMCQVYGLLKKNKVDRESIVSFSGLPEKTNISKNAQLMTKLFNEAFCSLKTDSKTLYCEPKFLDSVDMFGFVNWILSTSCPWISTFSLNEQNHPWILDISKMANNYGRTANEKRSQVEMIIQHRAADNKVVSQFAEFLFPKKGGRRKAVQRSPSPSRVFTPPPLPVKRAPPPKKPLPAKPQTLRAEAPVKTARIEEKELNSIANLLDNDFQEESKSTQQNMNKSFEDLKTEQLTTPQKRITREPLTKFPDKDFQGELQNIFSNFEDELKTEQSSAPQKTVLKKKKKKW